MKMIFGKTAGFKATDLKLLEKLYDKSIATHDIVTADFARYLCEVATHLGTIIGVLVDRKGTVTHVALGEQNRLYLPDIGRQRAAATRLRGLRLIVAKPQRKSPTQADIARKGFAFSPYEIDQDFIGDLEKLQLDLILQIEALPTGLPGRCVLAYLSAQEIIKDNERVRHVTQNYRQLHLLQEDLTELIATLEGQLLKQTQHLKKEAVVKGERDSAVLVGVYTVSKKEWEPSLDELKELARTAGVRVVDVAVQQRKQIDPRTIVGKGKLEEICLRALHKGAEVLIFDRDLSPSQLNAITDLTDLKVLDRTMLILDIFARRAKTRSGQLQVELAQLKYSLPRLAKKQTGLSRLTGGIGGQGPGETKLEIDRRRVKDKIARLEREVDHLGSERQLRRQKRNIKEVPTIAIVGYTNAGKSTLLNALTGADVYTKDELFATLDPTSRRLRFPKEREVILIDTVGFIRDLPEGLINAFRTTLEELHEADLLLHVIDASDPHKEQHIAVVQEILSDLKIDEPERLLVMNKADLLTPEAALVEAEKLGAWPVSAKTRAGLLELLNFLSEKLWQSQAIGTKGNWGLPPNR